MPAFGSEGCCTLLILFQQRLTVLVEESWCALGILLFPYLAEADITARCVTPLTVRIGRQSGGEGCL